MICSPLGCLHHLHLHLMTFEQLCNSQTSFRHDRHCMGNTYLQTNDFMHCCTRHCVCGIICFSSVYFCRKYRVILQKVQYMVEIIATAPSQVVDNAEGLTSFVALDFYSRRKGERLFHRLSLPAVIHAAQKIPVLFLNARR